MLSTSQSIQTLEQVFSYKKGAPDRLDNRWLHSRNSQNNHSQSLSCHFHITVTSIGRVDFTQAARAVVQHHVAKHIAVDAEVAFANSAFVARTFTCLLFFSILFMLLALSNRCVYFGSRVVSVGLVLVSRFLCCWRRLGKHRETAHTFFTVLLFGPLPADFRPITQRKEMVVASSKMRR